MVSLYRSAGNDGNNLMKMKVFLRNRETGQYYTGSIGWSGSNSVAHDFDAVEDAIQFARTERLVGMEVVLHFDEDPLCDLILPLR